MYPEDPMPWTNSTAGPRPPCMWCTRRSPTSTKPEWTSRGECLVLINSGRRKHTGGGRKPGHFHPARESLDMRAVDHSHGARSGGHPLAVRPYGGRALVDADEGHARQLASGRLDPSLPELLE